MNTIHARTVVVVGGWVERVGGDKNNTDQIKGSSEIKRTAA